ncbi:MAG: six-hairpin glycosidase, partial [Bacteroidetes bacterium]
AERWSLEHVNSHELYNAGHMYEAAYAHYMATGKRNFLDIALKNADLLVSVFGPDKKHVAPGHEIVEMGLVKLYRVTGKKEYLDLAKFFIDERGKRKYDANGKTPWEIGSYWQDNKPVVEQDEAVGHAVRAMYLYSAVADIAALTGDTSYLHAIDKIWENVVGKKMYVQGSLGAIPDGERFGDNYQLPNLTAYNETCAAIGNVYWNYRMFLLHGDSKYIDILEKSLYNGLISGVGMDGKSFFYTNGMQMKNSFTHSSIERERSGWFECSCCPTNICRLIPSVPGYMYAQKGNDIYVNLFMNSTTVVNLDNKQQVELVQENNYPWDGDLKFTVNPKSNTSFGLKIRIPGWAHNEAFPSDLYKFEDGTTENTVIRVNGQQVDYTVSNGYAVISRSWKKNDRLEVILPMEVKKIAANPKVKDDIGLMAIQRGPLVYCAEWADNNGKTSNIILPGESQFITEYRKDLLKGVVVLKSDAIAVDISDDGKNISTKKQAFIAIPYYSWAHRGVGEMNVWFPKKVKDIDLIATNP